MFDSMERACIMKSLASPSSVKALRATLVFQLKRSVAADLLVFLRHPFPSLIFQKLEHEASNVGQRGQGNKDFIHRRHLLSGSATRDWTCQPAYSIRFDLTKKERHRDKRWNARDAIKESR